MVSVPADAQAAGERAGRARAELGAEAGRDIDPRFSLANERTFLAWNRTALALIAGGLATARLLRVGRSGALPLILALALIAFGGYMSLCSYLSWRRSERLLRLGQPLAPSPLTRVLAIGVAACAGAAAALAVLVFVSW